VRRTNNRRSDQLVNKVVLANENDYYDLHGRFPEGSTRANPVAPDDQFWSDYTDSSAQERNRGVRLLLDPEINKQITGHLDAEFLSDLRDEILLNNTTGIILSAPNKSGRKDIGKTQHVPQYPDEALDIDIKNAEDFIRYADTTDPRTLTDEGRQQLMIKESTRFSPSMNNPVVQEALEAAERQLTGGSFTALGNAATSSSGKRKRARTKSKEEAKADAQNLLAQRIMGRSVRTGAQTDGRKVDTEHIIPAEVMPRYNNEVINKFPGPGYLNRSYGNAVGIEQLRKAQSHLDELYVLRDAMEKGLVLKQAIIDAPEMYSYLGPKYGKKSDTVIGNIKAKYDDKFSRFSSAPSFV
jgi:hypothetical protein